MIQDDTQFTDNTQNSSSDIHPESQFSENASPISSEDTTQGGQNGPRGDQSEMSVLLEKIQKLEQENGEYLSLIQRERADFLNFRKRMDIEKQESKNMGKIQVLREVFRGIEALDRALDHIPEEMQSSEFIQGILQTKNLFASALEQLGIEKIKTVGEVFDGNLHEALMQQTGENGKIVMEIMPGYMFKDGQVIEPAKVAVGNGQSES